MPNVRIHSSTFIISFTKSRFPQISDEALLAAFADFRLCSFQWLDTEDRERAMKAVKAYMKGQKHDMLIQCGIFT